MVAPKHLYLERKPAKSLHRYFQNLYNTYCLQLKKYPCNHLEKFFLNKFDKLKLPQGLLNIQIDNARDTTTCLYIKEIFK